MAASAVKTRLPIIHLTPEIVEAAYNLLKEAAPFKGWNLPDADDIEFVILRTRKHWADYSFEGKPSTGRHIIRLSHKKHSHLDTVLMSVAHEILHMMQQLQNVKESQHGDYWQQLADEVCELHGWDRMAF
jgi:hypothetical protein